MNKITGVLLMALVILLIGCSSEEKIEEGEMNQSLFEFAGIRDRDAIRFVIYNSEDIEIKDQRDLYITAIEKVQLTYRYKPEVTVEEAYGLMDIGNGVDTVKRVLLINKELIAIDDYYYEVSGAEALMNMVLKDSSKKE